MSYSKWIGGGLGWAFGGPIGGLVGFALGAMLDRLQGGDQAAEHPPHQEQRRRYTRTGPTLAGDMALSLVVLSAATVKA
ncbi:MAG: molecular chaperone DjiA, partial [Flavobacteriales bacterium]|nr:molecular chaperone DjiA [Flavobacteriales bacterium]